MAAPSKLMERRRQQAVEEIAHAALTLFLRDGFEATSVESITNAAGCSPRTFYRYFGDKEDVMFYDLPEQLNQLREHLDSHLAAGLGPWAAVSESVLQFIARFDSNDEEFATRGWSCGSPSRRSSAAISSTSTRLSRSSPTASAG